MVKVNHHPQVGLRIGHVEGIQHGKERLVKALRIKSQFLSADTDAFNPGLGQRRQPLGDVLVAQNHWVTAGHQDFTQALAVGFRMTATVFINQPVMLEYVVNDVLDLGQTLGGDCAVCAGDFFLGDQFFAVAEPAMRGTG